MPTVIIYSILLLLGASVGSFLNVCIFRIPKNESIVFPASHCQACRHPIAWWDNIPVLSFFLLKGRCRHCRAPISRQYVWVEVSSIVLFLFFYSMFGPTVRGVVYLVLSLALLTESLIDWKHQIIPDGITLPGIVIGLAVSCFFPELHGESVWSRGLVSGGLGILVGGGILYAVGTISERIMKKETMGGGDVKLLAMIGSVLGWEGVLGTLFISSFFGSVVGIILRWRRGQERIPFGPYLALGAFFYLFFGQQMRDAYIGLFKLS